MRHLKIVTIVGARPQFIKAAAVSRAIAAAGHSPSPATAIEERIVHTGQHYDRNMSRVFFDELDIPRPAVNLEVGSLSHAAQTAQMLERIERVLIDAKPSCVVIYGDTNSTLAGAIAAAKLNIPVAHVEAGLRSFNRRMPEEINRLLADRVSDLLLCPTAAAVHNLAREGMTRGVHRVGDVMYDSVLHNAALATGSSRVLTRLGLAPKSFHLATVHRAENTDDPARLAGIMAALGKLGIPVILPLHPRTRHALDDRAAGAGDNVRIIDPLPYLDMLVIEKNARVVLTDSGGVQKEAYWLGVPCVVLRDETEWVELVAAGCNRLAGADAARIVEAVAAFEAMGLPALAPASDDLYGDGHSAEQIVRLLQEQYASS